VNAVVVRTSARRVDVTGDDRVRYLEDVTSQHLVDVPVGHVRGTLYLDPHGAPLAMFDVAVLGDRLALLVPDDEVADTLVRVLGGRTFLLDASFEAVDAEVVAIRGEDAATVVSAAGLTAVQGRCRVAGDVLVVSRDQGGVDVAGPPDAIASVIAAALEAGAVEGDEDDLMRWRVAAGVPAWGSEVAPPHLPEELGLLPTHVHLAKGCYPGQEAVARMWMLGRPRRRLAVVTPSGAEVERGWETGSGRHKVTVTTVSPEGDRALAFVPGDAAPGDTFGGDDEDGPGGRVEVLAIVGADTSPPGHDPAIVRRRDRPRE
jgi:tRNA-modifying protein YgfZ